DLLATEHQDVGDAVHDDADHTSGQVQDDHHGLLVVFHRAHAEFHAKVHDGHDHPAQVGDALDEFGNIGDAGDRIGVIAADLLNLQDVDSVLFHAQREDQKLLTFAVHLLFG